MCNPQFLNLTGGGPAVRDSNGYPWNGTYVDSNGDLTVDLRSNIGAESRAKIVYEYLIQFTDDPFVKDTLTFLMTREVSHFQMFSAALETIQPNFPPGVLQHVVETDGLLEQTVEGTTQTVEEAELMGAELGKVRSKEIKLAVGDGASQWSDYPQQNIAGPSTVANTKKQSS